MSLENFGSDIYKEGFVTELESDTFPLGLNEDIVRRISSLKNEPSWMLDFRLKAFKRWQQMPEPDWSELEYIPVNYQELSYHSSPKMRNKDEIPQEILDTFDKLGVPLHERDALLGIESEKDDRIIPTVA